MTQRWKQEFIKISTLDKFYSFLNKEDGFTWNKDNQKWKVAPLSKLQFIKNLLKIDTSYGYPLSAGNAAHRAIQEYGFIDKDAIKSISDRTNPVVVLDNGNQWNVYKLNSSINNKNVIIPVDDCEGWLPKIDVHGITFFGKYDCKEPTRIHDIKSTKNMDTAKFKKSFQWRFYLLMSGLDNFSYHLFTMEYDAMTTRDKETGLFKLRSNDLFITNYNRLDIERPADLEEQINHAVKLFSDFLEENKRLIYDTACKHGITMKYFDRSEELGNIGEVTVDFNLV